jgi:DNA repair photolyase
VNKTAIEWCDYTWNPVTGCKHGCPYCYAWKIAERFKGSKAWPQGFEPMLPYLALPTPNGTMSVMEAVQSQIENIKKGTNNLFLLPGGQR